MNINVRWTDRYAEVSIEDRGTVIDLGLFNSEERKALADVFREAIRDLKETV